MAETFQISQSEPGPNTTVLRVQGHLDARSTPMLLERCSAVRSARRYLVLNLSEVTFIASSGVGGLLSLPEEFQEAGLLMRFASMSPAVDAVIKLLNLHQYLDIVASEEAALEVLGR